MHYEKICREFIYLTVLCDRPYLVSLLYAALLSLLLVTFSIFIITCLHHVLAAGSCISWSFPSQSSKTLSSQVADFLHWQYWLKNHWPIVWVNPFLALLVWRPGVPTDPCSDRHSNSMDNTSIIHLFIHSYNYIHMYDRDLPQSIQVWLTTQCIPRKGLTQTMGHSSANTASSSITCTGIPTPF